jgi:hypothetical protein
MKKIIYSFLVVILIISAFPSCKSSNIEKDVVGKWKVTYFNYTNLKKVVVQISKQLGLPDSALQTIEDRMKNDLDHSFDETYFDFKEDHTFSFGDETDYSWTYNPDKKEFDIKSSTGKLVVLKVKQFKNKKMDAVMSIENNGMLINIDLKLEKE